MSRWKITRGPSIVRAVRALISEAHSGRQTHAGSDLFHLGFGNAAPFRKRLPDAGEHVIGSYIKSKDIKTVMEECEKFGKEILHLPVLN